MYADTCDVGIISTWCELDSVKLWTEDLQALRGTYLPSGDLAYRKMPTLAGLEASFKVSSWRGGDR